LIVCNSLTDMVPNEVSHVFPMMHANLIATCQLRGRDRLKTKNNDVWING